MQRRDGYGSAMHIGGASPREAEVMALGLCNAKLAGVDGPRGRIDALHRNHALWSLLVRDLSGDGNGLPSELRRRLVDLGFWVMQYSLAAMRQDLPLQTLIDINQNILDGLRAQPERTSASVVGPAVQAVSAHA